MERAKEKDKLEITRRLKDCLNGVPEIRLEASMLTDWENDQEKRPVSVMIMGEAKAGKSTFVNAIFGEQIVASDLLPKTSIVTMFKYGVQKKMILYFLDGSIRIYENNVFADLSNAEIDKNIDWVEMFLPIDFLKKITIIDSPGLNSQYRYHTKNAERFMNRVDVVLWVTDCRAIETKVTHQYIEKLTQQGLSLFMVLNQIDSFDEEEEEQSVADWITEQRESLMSQYGLHDVIGVSAFYILKGKVSGDHQYLEIGRSKNLDDLFHKLSADAPLFKRNGKWRYLIYFQYRLLAELKNMMKHLDLVQSYTFFEEMMKAQEAVFHQYEDIRQFIKKQREKSRQFSDFVAQHKNLSSFFTNSEATGHWLDLLAVNQPPVVAVKIKNVKEQLDIYPSRIIELREELTTLHVRIKQNLTMFKKSGIKETYPLLRNKQLYQLEMQMVTFNTRVADFNERIMQESERQNKIIEQFTLAIQFINYHHRETLKSKAKFFNQSVIQVRQDLSQKMSMGFFEKVNQISDISASIIAMNQQFITQAEISEARKKELTALNSAFTPLQISPRLVHFQEAYTKFMNVPLIDAELCDFEYSTSELTMVDMLNQSGNSQFSVFDLSDLNELKVNIRKMDILAGLLIMLLLFVFTIIKG